MMREMTGLTLGVLGRTLLDADLSGFRSLGSAFEAMQDQAMFEMASMNLVPMWVPLPQQMRFRRARARAGGDRRRVGRAARVPGPATRTTTTRCPGCWSRPAGKPTPRSVGGGCATSWSPCCWPGTRPRPAPWAGPSTCSTGTREVLGADARRGGGGARRPAADLRGPAPAALHRMVLQEAMRLYPPVWMLSRRAQEADEIGGYRVPAGADVLICPYTLHRHPGFWDDPDRFDPERFAPRRRPTGPATPTSRSAPGRGSASATTSA